MKVMFEIYREAAGGRHRVVYFTELAEHERDAEIARAMRGEHVFDGFAQEGDLARRAIDTIVNRLNRDQPLDAPAIAAALHDVLI